MSRLRQTQNIDSLIENITTIIENRCSLSEGDFLILNEAVNLLKNLKRKKGKTNEQIIRAVVQVVELLSNFFMNESEN